MSDVKKKTLKAEFRLRGFVCHACLAEFQMYGEGDAFKNCGSCGSEKAPELFYDQFVESIKVITNILPSKAKT